MQKEINYQNDRIREIQTRYSYSTVLRAMYLDCKYNYAKLETFVNYHNITIAEANNIVLIGEQIHERYVEEMKGYGFRV